MNALTIKDERLQPAAAMDIAAALDKLFLTFDTKGPEDVDRQKQLLVIYVEALSKYPLWAIQNAVMRFIRGEVKPASKKFAPKPPEIAEACAEEMAEYHAERAKERVLEDRQREAKRDADSALATTQADRDRMLFKMQLLPLAIADRGGDRAERLKRVGQLSPDRQIPVLIGLAEAWGVPVPENIRGMS